MKKHHIEELRRISDSIPAEWKKDMVREELVAPEVVKTFEKALKSKKVSAETKRKAQNLLDSGILHKKHLVENREVVNKINKFLDEKIEQAIKLGRLPRVKSDKQMKDFIHKARKTWTKQNEESILGHSSTT